MTTAQDRGAAPSRALPLVDFTPRAALGFAVPFAVLFALTLPSWPYLADGYTSGFDAVANVALGWADRGGRIGFGFEVPREVRRAGSWQAVLRVEDREYHQVARMRLDVRAFSYRPMATFLAALLAARLKGFRRNAIVVGGGVLAVGTATSMLAAIAALRFGVAKVVGLSWWQRAIETAYEALTTPAMVYVVPLVLLWVLVRWTGDKREAMVDR